ncbi:putative amidoligase domain-containing protein [Brevibacillus ginsengisoli]|uniref:putative amidoligase domain-containing protein n=1 Tax=Brevibacillus ginsengisoli TaxID=363854 RepID=UPI003CEB5CFD
MTRWPIQDAASICRDSRRIQAILHIHGICSRIHSVESGGGAQVQESETFLRTYRIQLYQYHVLLLDRAEGTGVWLNHQVSNQEEQIFESIPFSSEDLEQRRVVQLAIRSIYALGLDYGSVMVGVNSVANMTILEVLPEFYTKDGYQQLEQEKLSDNLRVGERVGLSSHQVMLGADPEFALRDGEGKIGVASRYLEKQGVIGYDSARLRELMAHNLHPLVEIRPQPSHSPREVFRHILQAMRIGLKKIPANLEWIAGGMPFFGYPIGGHLHFSGIKLSFALLRCMDAFLALPLALIEDEGCKRRRSRYGFLGDYREQPYGGFEYRTLPSWLVSPLVTQGVLALAKVVATHCDQLTQPAITVSLNHSLSKAYYQGDKEKVRSAVILLWRNLLKLPMYREYQLELDAFYHYIMSNTRWNNEQDLRLEWGLVPHSTTPAKHAIILNEKMPSR